MKKILFGLFLAISSLAHSQCSLLCNTDFENNPTGMILELSQVPCWQTDASDNIIEVWGGPLSNPQAYSGSNFIELNANMVSTLYQDFTASLGTTVNISFAHRGRAGTDTMSIEIGPIGGPYTNLGTFSADELTWQHHTVSYTFPLIGTTNYTLRFNSIYAAGGPTVGNFLDDIEINIQPPTTTLNITNPSCHQSNGSLIINVSGNAPFNYTSTGTLNTSGSIGSSGSNISFSNISSGQDSIYITDLYGCQSSYSINFIDQLSNIYIITLDSICSGQTFTTHSGLVVSVPGFWLDTVSTPNSCDSIYEEYLLVYSPNSDTSNISICQGDSYNFEGVSYTNTGFYTSHYFNIHGCDSIKNLNLLVRPTYYDTITQNICQGSSFIFNNISYSTPGSYNTTFTTTQGCDSFVTLNLLVHPTSSDTLDISICYGTSYNFQGNSYNTPGFYTSQLTTSFGCDSIKNLNLSVVSSFEDTISTSTCQGVGYVLPSGQTVFNPGNYSSNLLSSQGCDSNITTILSVYPNYTQTVTDTLCPLDTYTLPNGISIQGSSINYFTSYFHDFQTVNGCDSNITTNLYMIPNPSWFQSSITPTTTIPYGDSIQLFVSTNQSGNLIYDWSPSLSCNCSSPTFTGLSTTTYTVTITDQNGCYTTNQTTISVLPEHILPPPSIFIPNSFTPNGDGNNDDWKAYLNISDIKYFHVLIFNRWGEKMFETNNPLESWIGSYNGLNAPESVYVYYLQIVWMNNETPKEYKGSITLLR